MVMTATIYPLAGRSKRGPLAKGQLPPRDLGYENRRIVGARVAELREAAGLTQLELARTLEIRDTAVSAIELGRNSLSPERYAHTADALGVDRRKFGKFLLRHYNPWLFAMLFPNEISESEIRGLPERIKTPTGE